MFTVAAAAALRDSVTRPEWVVFIEVSSPYSVVAEGGGMVPGFQIVECQVGVRGVVDVEDA